MAELGFDDLGWILIALFFGWVFVLSDIPATVVRRLAPTVRAFLRGDVIQVRVKPDTSVNRLRTKVLAEQARTALQQGGAYVKSEPDTADTNTPIPVLGTGIGVDTRYLAKVLTEAQRLEIMALARNPDGKWAHSGKKLFTAFGGNYNEFVATMRHLRGGTEDDPMEEPTIYTPIAGRPTKASYYDDPRLEYQAPPQ